MECPFLGDRLVSTLPAASTVFPRRFLNEGGATQPLRLSDQQLHLQQAIVVSVPLGIVRKIKTGRRQHLLRGRGRVQTTRSHLEGDRPPGDGARVWGGSSNGGSDWRGGRSEERENEVRGDVETANEVPHEFAHEEWQIEQKLPEFYASRRKMRIIVY